MRFTPKPIFENLKDAIFNILYKMEEDLSFDPHKLDKLTTVHWAARILACGKGFEIVNALHAAHNAARLAISCHKEEMIPIPQEVYSKWTKRIRSTF